jgi:two-component sensor histidine kinase/CheY-like chemotaxis protein
MKATMHDKERVNILLVDDQPGKLMTYEVILKPLHENLVSVTSGREALARLLTMDVAVILVDIEMPELNGFELAAMIRQHPRFEKTAIIFVSAVHYKEADTIRGYNMGAVDYVSVPVIAEVLRAKVQVFVDLYRKTRDLERFNETLERRVKERTAELTTAIERQTILAREVDHRAKNALAVVQSIVRLTRSPTIETYMKTIESRIGALSRSHNLLSESHWAGANIRQIIESEIEPYATDISSRFDIAGPDLMLPPAASQSLTLVIHELTTNAAKYGSLSTEQGCLSVKFGLEQDQIYIDWHEHNGPKTDAPLISVSVNQLNGSASFDWNGDGLKCRIVFPYKGDAGIPPPNHSELISPGSAQATTPVALLVEDEPLVGMMMSDFLSKADFQVLGPFTRVDTASSAVESQPIDVALLDINLNGQLVYPLATKLRTMGVPIIFVSGYAEHALDENFTGAPVLNKPVNRVELEKALGRLALGKFH